jgi:hypothetical protein
MVALLDMVTVALDAIVPRGAKVTLNEAVPVGATTSGRDGRFPRAKNAPAILMELIVRGLVPVLVMVKVCLDEVVIGTLPKVQVLGVTVMPMDGEVTVKALASVSTSVPVVTVSGRVPGVATELMLRTAVALVKEFTVSEITVMPAPKFAWLAPCWK